MATAAAAHIQLDAPTVRYSNAAGEVNKSCPCGGGDGDQRCANEPTSDDGRDEGRATTLAPGSTIVVRWRETIGHSGRFRVAFDDDGADLADFNANILADISDPSDGSGPRSVEVTLPDLECERCALQLIQDMNGIIDTPVADPTGDPTYFQCADLVLKQGGPAELEATGCSSTASSLPWWGLPLLARRRSHRPRHSSPTA